METQPLSPNQRRILQSLVELIDNDSRVVSGSEIAADVGRNPGTIRNQMQSLSALQLVEGIPGPRGGYKPTAAAYRALDDERLDDPADVPVERNSQAVGGINVEKIDLETVHSPNLCRAEISMGGAVSPFSPGDSVTIGPTPTTGLLISGTVEGVDPGAKTITLDVASMQTPTEPVAAD